MSSWQHWVVALIVVLCVWSIVKSVRTFVRRSRKGENPCDGCSCGCSGGCPSAGVKKEMKKNSGR